ncbi:collagen alpha-1(I) chain-like [Poecile atricapillus]|uniref:collagen alpha-1(I) chain-like n=1 Tax=Poecile atricapillus TaxID=48891 RepID=UPI002739F3FF|nr:collagen alpha-1(I) chain-like [Poecile atricapillus]
MAPVAPSAAPPGPGRLRWPGGPRRGRRKAEVAPGTAEVSRLRPRGAAGDNGNGAVAPGRLPGTFLSQQRHRGAAATTGCWGQRGHEGGPGLLGPGAMARCQEGQGDLDVVAQEVQEGPRRSTRGPGGLDVVAQEVQEGSRWPGHGGLDVMAQGFKVAWTWWPRRSRRAPGGPGGLQVAWMWWPRGTQGCGTPPPDSATPPWHGGSGGVTPAAPVAGGGRRWPGVAGGGRRWPEPPPHGWVTH